LIFMLAGHETTATALACALFELARSEHWQQRLQQEVDEVLGERPPTAADMARLTWTDRAVRETMRLYPSAHSIGRHVEREDVIGGYRIPAGADVVISPFVVHRSPRVWADPDVFDPTRFDVPVGEFPGGHRQAWIPFGAGPHTCVGMQLALLEAPLVLATILQAFRFETDLDSLPLVAAVSLRPAAPVRLRLTTRNG
jgi:cytochrome P450